MKKILSTLIASALLLTTACSGSPQEISSGEVSTQAVTTEAAAPAGEAREDISGLSSQEIVSAMTIGWNLGNTLDACQADRDGDGVINEHVAEGEEPDETLWGNPRATKELFQALLDSGVNAVRIPVTWRDHIDGDGDISPSWLDRVQEVVDYAYDLGMYTIINIHHDGGGDPQFGAWICNAATDYDATLARYLNLWTQIADRFKDYDEHLIFESMNEVGFDSLSQGKAYELLNSLNQEFVDLIRSSGGKNNTRHLLIAGYWTDIAKTCDPRYVMPTDPVNRSIVSVHYYTPWDFCTTNIKNEWGTAQEQQEMERLIGMMKTNFVDKGIPVIIGEYAASGNDFNSCVFFCEKLVKLCHDYGIATFLWDNGNGQFDRSTNTWRSEQMHSALLRAVSGEDYTPEKSQS